MSNAAPPVYEVECNVPLPPPSRGRPEVYPWSGMKKGDSFIVPFKDHPKVEKEKLRGRLTKMAASYAKRRPGTKFASRSLDDGVRIWRIA